MSFPAASVFSARGRSAGEVCLEGQWLGREGGGRRRTAVKKINQQAEGLARLLQHKRECNISVE